MNSIQGNGSILHVVGECVKRIGKADFIDDLKTIDAVERCFERIAEAVRKLGSEFDAKYPDLDLPALRQFGNVLRHDYDTVQPILLWGYIQKRLDTLEDMAQWELKE